MTTHHRAMFHCPNCQTFVTAETMFGRWIRNNKDLDSDLGYAVSDQDYFIYQFKRNGDRNIHCMMSIEIKTCGRTLSDSQKEILNIHNQLIRNRGTTSRHGWKQSGYALKKVKSIFNGNIITVRHYGVHILTFEKLGPDDSDWIKWDQKHIITKETLTSLLRFDLDPDELTKIDIKSHHGTSSFDVEEVLRIGLKNKYTEQRPY